MDPRDLTIAELNLDGELANAHLNFVKATEFRKLCLLELVFEFSEEGDVKRQITYRM